MEDREVFQLRFFKIPGLTEYAQTLTSISKHWNGPICCLWKSKISYKNGFLDLDLFGIIGKEAFLTSPIFPLSRPWITKILGSIEIYIRKNYVSLIPLHLNPYRILIFKGILFVTAVRNWNMERFKVAILNFKI